MSQRGIYRKFNVTRVDGRDRKGEKHRGCRYFVLDLDHDPYAAAALKAYALACERAEPELSDELTICLKANKIKGLMAAQFGKFMIEAEP